MVVQLCSLCICWIPGVLGKEKFTQDLETSRRPKKAARGRSNRTKMLTITAILPNRTSGKMHTPMKAIASGHLKILLGE